MCFVTDALERDGRVRHGQETAGSASAAVNRGVLHRGWTLAIASKGYLKKMGETGRAPNLDQSGVRARKN